MRAHPLALRCSRRRSLALLGAVCTWVLPALSWAWPVEREFALKKEEARFIKLSAAEWIEVDDASIVSAELFETQEILLEAKKPGVALLLVYAEKRAAVWRVVVEETPPAPRPKLGGAAPNPLQGAQEACPKLRFQTAKLPKIAGHVETEACRQALLLLLRQPGWLARELELVFEMEVLWAQGAAMQKAVDEALGKDKVKLRYVGATLEMSGRLGPGEHRRALWNVFFQAAGRIALDDRIQLVLPPKLEIPKERKL